MSDFPSSTFTELMNNKEHPFDLFLTLIFSTISVILIILLPDGNPIRIAASLPLLVFFPGYALVAFLWPEGYGKEEYSGDLKAGTTEAPKERAVKSYERTILSIGLSLLITPAIGVGLSIFWEIVLEPLLFSIFVFIMIVSGLAWFRRGLLEPHDRFSIQIGSMTDQKMKGTERSRNIMVFLISISLVISSIALLYVHTTSAPNVNYTEFYLLDTNRSAGDLPGSININESQTFTIGIVSHESDTTSFSVIVDLINATGERQNRTIMEYGVILGPGSMDEFDCTFEIHYQGEYKLEIELYRGLDQQAYLENHLWLVVG